MDEDEREEIEKLCGKSERERVVLEIKKRTCTTPK